MTKITFITHNEQEITVDAEAGDSLMDAAVNNNVPGIDADCEGGCACATCHVIVDDAFASLVGKADEDEKYLIDFLDNQQLNSRLSCQIEITDELNGMVVHVPNE